MRSRVAVLQALDLVRSVVREAVDAKPIPPNEAYANLEHTMRMIAIVDQGAGGNLTWEEMAKSAMSQARRAICELEQASSHSKDT